MNTQLRINKTLRIVALVAVLFITLTWMSGAAQAGTVGSGSSSDWAICHGAPDFDETNIADHSGGNHEENDASNGKVDTNHWSDTITVFFNVLRITGPLLGTLIFIIFLTVSAVGVASGGRGSSSKFDKGKKALGYGFAVPVAVALMEVLLDNALLPGKELGCFFP